VVYLVYAAGWPVVIVGVASIVAAIIYTGGPWPTGYHALGDLFTFVFFGVVAVTGTYYVQAQELSGAAWFAALPMGCTVTAILVVNNLRDRVTDLGAGKRTLAVRYGRAFALNQYRALLGVSYLTPVGLWLTGSTGPEVMLPLLSLPLALKTERAVTATEGRALNPLLAATAKLLAVFGVLFALGLCSRALLSQFGVSHP